MRQPPYVLFCTAVNPSRNRFGEEIRAKFLIRSLLKLGCEVTVLANNRYEGATPNRQTENIDIAPTRLRESHLQRAKSLAVLPQLFLRNGRFLASAQETLARTPDVVFLDWGHLGQYVKPFRERGCRVVISTHNVESQITAQVPVRNALGWAKREIRRLLELSHERLFFPDADAVIHVSRSDGRYYEAYIPASKLFYLPNFVDESVEPPPPQRAARIIMTGSFSNYQNREAARWFLNAIWDRDLAALAEFCIAGSDSEKTLRELGSFPNVTALGEVDDMRREIRASQCAIVPILQGGGTRIKCIEAMAERTPVVSTTLGAEGLNTKDTIWLADQPVDFKKAIISVLTDPTTAHLRAEAAHDIFRSEYSLEANLARVRQLMLRLCPGSKIPSPTSTS